VISERLDEWYQLKGVRDAKERAEQYGGHKIGPSNLADCLRKHAFLLSGLTPEPISPESLRVFELGHQRGEQLERACKEIWPDAQSQVAIEIPLGNFKLQGTCDLWIPSLHTIVDFKTIGSFGAGLLAQKRCAVCMGNGYLDVEREPWKVTCIECRGSGITGGVSEEYQLQVHAYRWGLAFHAGYSVLSSCPGPETIRCLIVYEAKDSDARKGIEAGKLIELEVPWTLALEKRYQERLLAIEGLLIRKAQGNLDPLQVPGLPKDHWKCRTHADGRPKYCPVGPKRGQCHP